MHRRRGGVGGVDGLAVDDHRQAQHAVALLEHPLERAQVDPDAVGVEEAVALHVLEGLLVLVGDLRGLAQHEAAVVAAAGEVAALAVGLRAVDDL